MSAQQPSEKKAIRVLVAGAAGQIGYSLIPLIASGDVFGPTQPLILHLLDIEVAQTALSGVVMEIEDANYPLVHGVVPTFKPEVAFKDINYAFLVGGFPRKDGMERKDLMAKNVTIFVEQGEALEKYADKNVKVLVVANPANTNCLICSENAPSIPKENFSALTRLDHNRARAQLAKHLNVNVNNVHNVTIWGNHSASQVPDLTHAKVVINGKEQEAAKLVDQKWVETEFRPRVQKRGAEVIKARGNSSALSAAKAAADHMASWVKGTVQGEHVSMAVYSDGSYGAPKGVYFSFPVTCANGKYTIVQGLPFNAELNTAFKKTADELVEEFGLAKECIQEHKQKVAAAAAAQPNPASPNTNPK